MGVTRALSEFIVSADETAIPERDLVVAARSFTDSIGVALAARSEPLVQTLVSEMGPETSRGPASVLGCDAQVSADGAALLNGAMIHAIDYDDLGGYGHPSAPLVPALLAAAELRGGVTGRELVSAYCVGFEAAATLRELLPYDQMVRGFHGSAIFGGLAAAAGCARLLGLDAASTSMALGIASSQSSGLVANFGTMTKALHCGFAAQNGMRSALLARHGVTACDAIIETSLGFADVVVGCDAPGTTAGLAGQVSSALGSPYKVADRIRIKNYPSCAASHSAIDGMLTIRAEHGLVPDDIEEIAVEDLPSSSPVLLFGSPTNGLEAKFSLTYNVAVAAVHGAVRVEHFADSVVHEARVTDMMGRVKVKALPASGSQARDRQAGCTPVAVRTRDGSAFGAAVPRSQIRGSVRNPLSEAEFQAKYRRNVRLVVGSAGSAAELYTRWSSLLECPDVAVLLELTRAASTGS
jgi:Uncharacterized protein involved in propionate catabolism